MTSDQFSGDGSGGLVADRTDGPVLFVPKTRPSAVLVTGYPTPAAAALVEQLLAAGDQLVYCLVAPGRMGEATGCAAAVERGRGRLRLLEGTVNAPGLGLGLTARMILDCVEEIYHHAEPDGSIADAMSRPNLDGHLWDFAEECSQLRRLHVMAVRTAGADPDSTRKTSARASFLPRPQVPAGLRVLGKAALFVAEVPVALLAYTRTLARF